LQPFSGVWRPDLVGLKFLGEFPAKEGCNSAIAGNYRTKGKEIDLSDLACSCWENKRAYAPLNYGASTIQKNGTLSPPSDPVFNIVQ
jgi:hypothetical protein